MNERLKNIMANVFGIEVEEINEMTSVDNCEQWDSFQHMSLLVAIEEEFGLNLDDDEVLRMKDFASIIDVLETRSQ
ncbi:MAG: acyl carrier protein [Gammaproteobacteria bacterium]|nr:acyl carrier protein [Gammaproteobacteria bacterium]|tara:strand:+ start:360 stop:587 length:228 start_codon:yes stop_codon:yes gene_type:complete